MNENVISREAAIARIRQQLIAIQEEGKSVCQVAAERNVLCRGFHRDTDEELRYRYAEKIEKAPALPRETLQAEANRWQLERQHTEGTLLCCDVQYMFYETCRAWDDFSNEDLARFCAELAGESFRVVGTPSPAVL